MAEFDPPYRINYYGGGDALLVPFRAVDCAGNVQPLVLVEDEARAVAAGIEAALAAVAAPIVGSVHVPIERLLWPDPVVAGMNYLVVASLTYMYRGSNEDADPITVRAEGAYWRIVDGRHRAVASMVAGRKTVLAVVEPPSVAEDLR
ncbi:MAG: hypothetical protein K0S37_2395 [Microbacterium sp.]|jgi:hypothetical protein|nr:hypothetical protein [Microbacterium sp.]